MMPRDLIRQVYLVCLPKNMYNDLPLPLWQIIAYCLRTDVIRYADSALHHLNIGREENGMLPSGCGVRYDRVRV